MGEEEDKYLDTYTEAERLEIDVEDLEEGNKKLNQKVNALTKKIEMMEPKITDLINENKELKKENTELRKENKELHQLLGERAESDQPLPSFVKENQHHRHQKPGQKEGHEGTSRPTPNHIDETKDATVNRCPNCGGAIDDIGERERTIETIIPAKVHVKMIKVHRYWCPCCGKIVDAPVTDAFPNCRFGLEVYLLVAFMRYRIGMTYEKIREMLQIPYDLNLSRGELPQMMDRLAYEFGNHYEDLLQELRHSLSINGDETGWRVDGKNAWLWAFIGKGIALYTIEKCRGKKVVKRILGKHYKGVLGSDFWSAYNLDGIVQQKCHVHLKRDLKEVAEGKDGRSQFHRFKKKLKRILDDGVRAKERIKGPEEKQTEKCHLDQRVVELCDQNWTDKDCKRIVKRLRGRGKDLFTFLVKDIGPDNNIAERGIRPAVIMRKNSYGNRSDKGADTTSVLLSVVETSYIRGRNFLDWSSEYFKKQS